MSRLHYVRILFLLLALGIIGGSPRRVASDESIPAPESGPLGAASAFGGVCLRAILDGDSEVPPVVTSATGEGLFLLTPDRTQLVYDIIYDDLGSAETAAHIHQAAPGDDGGVAFDLPGVGPKEGVISLTREQAAAFERGEYYVNINTAENPEGEIRGQIWPAGDCFGAHLRGGQEAPSVLSNATGYGIFALATDRTRLLYHITHTGLSSEETMAHIHIGPRGTSGGIVFDLPVGSPKRGTVAMNPTSATSLLNGLLYVNIHSLNFGNGEIRGQIAPTSRCFAADLTSSATVPLVESDATGSGYFVLANSGLQLRYNIQYRGFATEEFAAHIRRGAPGVAGDVIISLPAGSLKRGTSFLSTSQAADLHAGRMYVNIASTEFLFGEIRGQIVPTPCMRLLPMVAH